MNLFVQHPEYGVGKIHSIEGNKVTVFFPHALDSPEKSFTTQGFAERFRRYILKPGTTCLLGRQPAVVVEMVIKGEGSNPNVYLVALEDGKTVTIAETEIDLTIIQDDREVEEEANGLAPGMIVETRDKYGFGKIKNVHNELGICDVAFFHQPGKEEVHCYKLEDVERIHLYHQTRVYVQQNGKWQVGHIIGKGSGKRLFYTVRFPKKRDVDILEKYLYVRCLSATQDPVSLLSNQGLETQFFHDARMHFVRRVTKMRNLSRGLTGMLSSSVELVEHQIMAARQVLSDPVQRYILADEVGLGKTIEAGFIIRQVLIDNPRCTVAVVVPAALQEQWEEELCTKFRVEQFPHPPQILTYEESNQLENRDVELLVVDEAHNIFRPEGCNDELVRAALSSQRLLLLTATPVIGHEETFLNMLRVLDPDVHTHTDLESFRKKATSRKEFGTLARMLDNAERISPIALINAKKLLADDPKGTEFVEAITQAREAESENLPIAIRALHRHIVEHCRIYHRLIRNRRKDIREGLFLPRSDSEEQKHVRSFPIGGELSTEHIELFEEWRQAAHEMLITLPEEANDHLLRELSLDCAELFEAVGCGTFGNTLKKLIHGGRPGGRVQEVAAIAAATTDRDEKLVLQDLERAMAELLEFQKDTGTRPTGITDVVVFVSDEDLAEGMNESYDSPSGFDLTFLSRQQEEGQNHQNAQAIIHLDIPLDPVRMEQRIGRLDRFSRSAMAILHVCGVPGRQGPGNPWSAWFDVLAGGYRIFNEPISDVQFMLEKERITLAEIILLRGVAGITAYNEKLPERLRIERASLDDQYALDKPAASEEDGLSWFEELDEGDYEEKETAQDLEAWMCQALNLNAKRDTGGVTYSWNRSDTLIPAYPWEHRLGCGLGSPATYDRVRATRDARFDLIRVGHPLVDAMEQFCRWDIRGVAFATWRQAQKYNLEAPLPVLQMDFIIEGDLLGIESDFSHTQELAIARRRSDSLLPPWTKTVHLHLDATPVTHPEHLELLGLPFMDKMTSDVIDVNLKSRQDALSTVVAPDFLASRLPHIEEAARSLIRQSEDYIRKTRSSERMAQEEFENRTLRLRTRYENIPVSDKHRQGQLLEDLLFEETINQAVLKPQIRLESVGLFILANTPPSKGI